MEVISAIIFDRGIFMKIKEKTKDKIVSTNRLVLPILFFVSAVVVDLANLFYLGLNGGGIFGLPTYFLFDISIILMLSALIYVCQNKFLMFLLFFVFLGGQAIMGGVNATLFKMFGEILSFSLMKLGAEARAAFSMEMLDWGGIALNVALFVFFSSIAIMLIKFNKTTFAVNRKKLPFVVMAVFLVLEAGGFGIFQFQASNLQVASAEENQIQSSDKYLWENFQFKTDAYKKFGFFGFYVKDIVNHVFPKVVPEDLAKQYVQYIDDGHVDGNPNALLYEDNLIVILLESTDMFAIDPIYTPTLWKLWNGYHSATFKNFYARNRTNNSEGITLLGSMPKDSALKDAFINGYEFQYSLPNLFKQSGSKNVVTNYIHQNYSTFYDRSITHKTDGIGFDNMITLEKYTGDQEFKWGDWMFDKDYFEGFVDELLPTDTRFLTFFSTMSTHGGWTTKRTYFEKYYEIYDQHVEEYKTWFNESGFVFPEIEYDYNLLRNFKVGTMDLDATISMILEQLKVRGLEKNTSILMFTDHNTYINDLAFRMRGIDKSDFSNVNVNHIPAILYSPKLYDENGIEINSFCNTYDLLPTLCDLYGMPSNNNLFLGYSVFSEEIENSFFASHLGGMFTDKIYSQNITDVVTMNENVTAEEIEKFRQCAVKYFEKQEKMEKIYYNGINGTKLKRSS